MAEIQRGRGGVPILKGKTGQERSPLVKAVVILVVVLGIPGVLLSSPGLEKADQYVHENWEKPWAPLWEHRIALAYSWTTRGDKAVEKFERAAQLYLKQSNYDAASWELYQKGDELEDIHRREEARKVWTDLTQDELMRGTRGQKEAVLALERLHNIGR
jgi:hypothetical protein